MDKIRGVIGFLLALFLSILSIPLGFIYGATITEALGGAVILFLFLLFVVLEYLRETSPEEKEKRRIWKEETDREYEEEERIRRRAKIEEEARLEARDDYKYFRNNRY